MCNLLSIIFLISSILSCIKIVSTKPISSSLFPFILVLSIGIALDLIEELKRYKNDVLTNGTITHVYKLGKFHKTEWSKIKVGNLIKVKKDEVIPADLLIIASSNPEGSFYLQTSNLDGETNLKERESLSFAQKIFLNKKIKKDEENLTKIFQENWIIEVEQPTKENKNFYETDGKINLKDNNKIILFDNKNCAIRGARLKNTNFIYGIAIYTGKETKIMMNIIKVKVKFAYLDKLVDSIIIIIIILRFIFVIIFSELGIYFKKKFSPNYEGNKIEYDYLFYYRHFNGEKKQNNHLENLKYYTSYIIVTQSLLPTSVVLLLAITKIIQSLFIEYLDISLREDKNEKMKCYSNELLSELGSVKYIFSDKTGTLTRNQTQFKACSIYTFLFDESDESYYFDKNRNPQSYAKSTSKLISSSSSFSLTFNSSNLLQRLNLRNVPLEIKNIEGCPFNNQGEVLEEFVLNMTLNHNIVVENKNGTITYQGTNPDEITLVGAAKELGYEYLGKYKNIMSVKRKLINEKEEKSNIIKYKLLKIFPFKSERQRSTIIVKDLQTNIIKLYIKGNDVKIFGGINKYSKDNILEITKNHVDDFARRGLRTLCYSYKTISEKDYKNWIFEYNKTNEDLQLDKKLKQEKLDSLIVEIEKDCFLLGATALEDQLQENVDQDIKEFIQAGINFWMLTGDKMDTAESIGNSIKLFDSDTEVFKIDGTNNAEIIERMEEIKHKINEIKNELSNFNINDEYIKKKDINLKVNSLSQKMKKKIENIYEDDKDEDKEFSFDCKNKNTSKELALHQNNEKNYNQGLDKESNSNRKINSMRNMSILKFMIDDQFFIYSNIEYDNLSIFRGKILKPSIEYSNKSDNSKNNDINMNGNNIVVNINKSKFREKKNDIENGINTNRINIEKIKDINNNLEDNKVEKSYNKNLRKRGEEYSHESSINEPLKDYSNNNNYNEIKKNYSFRQFKENQRKIVNLPTDARKFLNYFEIYLRQIKESLYIQQQAFFIFKLPYIYAPIEKDFDSLKEFDWKSKLKFKNFLLHTKLKYSLIINGKSINYCISEGRASELFWFLIKNSRSVICSQCLPIQKSKIVEFVKKHTKEITLAIGDGENDVNMIKTAHIGIGLFGKEGNQAAFNSDYAFYQFKYLKRLLFYNGRFTLLRNTYFLNMFFFKNFLYNLIPIIFSFFSLFSGVFFYDEFYDAMFNTFVSIIPLIVFSVLDEDVDFEKCNEKKQKWIIYLLPDLYKQTRDSKPFNIVKYIICTFISIIYALVIFFCCNYIYMDMIRNFKGENSTYYDMIFNIYFIIVFLHFFMIFIDSSLINYLVIIFFIIQIFSNLLFIIIFNKIDNDSKLSGIVGKIIHSYPSFFGFISVGGTCCLPFYILRRAELYFGINYSNFIKTNKLEAVYLGNYYKKEIHKMIRAVRAIAKFKRIHKEYKSNKISNEKNENYNDRKMRKVIERWEEEKCKKNN